MVFEIQGRLLDFLFLGELADDLVDGVHLQNSHRQVGVTSDSCVMLLNDEVWPAGRDQLELAELGGREVLALHGDQRGGVVAASDEHVCRAADFLAAHPNRWLLSCGSLSKT